MRPSLLAALIAPVLATALACASSRPQASGPGPTPKADSAGPAPSDTARSSAIPPTGAEPRAGTAPGGPA